MLTKDKILIMLHTYKEKHKEQYGIEQIGLFGSYAKDKATDQSDVDVFISLKHSNLFLLSRIRIELEELMGIPTDIVQLRERMNKYLKKRIEQEAISA
jgi:predicted nucleotidyltransferase